MQREIKFRGKRVDTGQWVYGYYVERFNNDHVIYASEIHNGDCFLVAYSVIPETVGQYTGLKDENGKKIYDGDIVVFEDMTSTESGYCWGNFDDMEYDEEREDYKISKGWFEAVTYAEEFAVIGDFVIAWRPVPEPWREE